MRSKIVSFLSRSRTISNVAEYFGISIREAEQLISGAVKSGKVAVSPGETRMNSPNSAVVRGVMKPSLSRTHLTVGQEKLPGVRGSQVHSSLCITDPRKLRFKVVGFKPCLLTEARTPMNLAGLGGQRMKTRLVVSGQASLSLQMRVLEVLSRGPRTMTDLHGDWGISRSTLARLLRKGMLKQVWGRQGVGLFYDLTQTGLEELRRLKAVSIVHAGATTRLVAPMTYPPW